MSEVEEFSMWEHQKAYDDLCRQGVLPGHPKMEKIRKAINDMIAERKAKVALHKSLFLGREKASDVGKPLKK